MAFIFPFFVLLHDYLFYVIQHLDGLVLPTILDGNGRALKPDRHQDLSATWPTARSRNSLSQCVGRQVNINRSCMGSCTRNALQEINATVMARRAQAGVTNWP